LAFYCFLYRFDPLAVFRKRKASWNSVFTSLGLPFTAEEKRKGFALLISGLVLDAFGFFTDSLYSFFGVELAGTLILVYYLGINVPLPFPPRDVTLPYPRQGRAVFEKPEEKGSPGSVSVDVSRIKLFYVSYRNGLYFSLPESKQSLSDVAVGFLEQTKPGYAWIQIAYVRASFHRQLEMMKLKILREKELYRHQGKNPVWISHADLFLKKIGEALASDIFAVSFRGMLIDGDPLKLNVYAGDEVDSLAVFETKDPGLLYEMAKQRMSLYLPKARHEPGFFIVKDLSFVAFPPSFSRTAQVAPLGLEAIMPFDSEEEKSAYNEAVTIPAVDPGKPFYFPADGIMDIVWDGSVHVMFSGSLREAFKAMGVVERPYDPMVPFKAIMQGQA